MSLTLQDQLQIFSDPDTYVSLISKDVDTTTAESASDPTAYDRIVITKNFEDFIITNSATAFNFAESFGISVEEAFEVSDHYPVEFKMPFTPNGPDTDEYITIYSENFDALIGSEWSCKFFALLLRFFKKY